MPVALLNRQLTVGPSVNPRPTPALTPLRVTPRATSRATQPSNIHNLEGEPATEPMDESEFIFQENDEYNSGKEQP